MTTFNLQVDDYRSVYLSWNNVTWTNCGGYRDVSWVGGDSPNPAARTHNVFSKTKNASRNELLVFRQGPSGPTWTTDSGSLFPGLVFAGYVGASANDIWGAVSEELYGNQLNAAVAFAEGNQTLGMLADTARRVRLAWESCKKGNLVKMMKHLGYRNVTRRKMRRARDGAIYEVQKVQPGFDPASLWLEHRYGWLPLYSDVYEAMRFVWNLSNRPLRKRFKAGVATRGVYATYAGGISPPSISNFRKGKNIRYVELYEDYAPSLWDNLGFDNPALVLWEKTPFSFVWDWWMPIGTYLEARQLVRRLKGRYFNVYKYEARWAGKCDAAAASTAFGSGSAVLNIGQAEHSRWTWEHRRGAWADISQAEVKVPPLPDLFTWGHNWKRAVTSVALVTTLSKGVQARAFLR